MRAQFQLVFHFMADAVEFHVQTKKKIERHDITEQVTKAAAKLGGRLRRAPRFRPAHDRGRHDRGELGRRT